MHIYVALMNEGTAAWRPVDATHENADLYRIISQHVPNDQEWEFAPGALVRCVERRFSDGERALVAVALA